MKTIPELERELEETKKVISLIGEALDKTTADLADLRKQIGVEKPEVATGVSR